jgi:hypothetical protein
MRHTLALLVLASVTASIPARADERSCIAASENEVGLRKQQKLKAALEQLALCSAPACPGEVRTECDQRAAEVNAAMPTIVLGATDAAGNDLIAVTVTLDGVALATQLDGRALSLDPGEHTLKFAGNGVTVDKTFVAKEGEKGRRITVVLDHHPAVVSPPVTPAAPAPVEARSTWTTQKTLALVAGGVGVVGLGLGTGFGVIAIADVNASKSDCPNGACTSSSNHANAVSEHSTAGTMGDVSTAGFVVGGVGVAAALVLWFTSPKTEKGAAAVRRFWVDPLVGTRSGVMTLGGSF